jgi:hypothetical protein
MQMSIKNEIRVVLLVEDNPDDEELTRLAYRQQSRS